MQNKIKINLILLVIGGAVVWWYLPTIGSLAAMRPQPQPVQYIAPQTVYYEPAAQPLVVAPAPSRVEAAELEQMAVNQAAPIAPARLVVAPPTLAPADPSPTAGAPLLRIETAGLVWELTPARLVDCINAQQNGQPTGPTCPPNAATYAGMLGQGR